MKGCATGNKNVLRIGRMMLLKVLSDYKQPKAEHLNTEFKCFSEFNHIFALTKPTYCVALILF